jgi:hypothetical protein
MKNWVSNPNKKTVITVSALWLLALGCIMIASDFFKSANLMTVLLLIMSFFSVVTIFTKYIKTKKRA